MKIISVGAIPIFLVWILLEIFRERKREEAEKRKSSSVFTKVSVTSNVIISITQLSFIVYQVLKFKTISSDSAFQAIIWVLVSTFALWFRVIRENKQWPLVLISWWVFSTISYTFTLSFYFISHLRSTQISAFFPEPNMSSFISYPFSILLCFNIFTYKHSKKPHEIKHPLLEKEAEEEEEEANVDSFVSSGIWSHITFRWLNPLFKIGHTRKVELSDIPLVPEQETANVCFSLLEESIQNNKSETFILTRAVIRTIWRPLVINAVFAGINTIASYMGPFLITNFVDFLSEKNDNSTNRHGLVLAFIFFFAKTIESLSQRHWYFGAHRISIRVRSCLTVSTYTKTLSMKYSSLNNGKVINLVNSDIEKVGDFCWYIHGMWLLPVQVILALVILYRSIGLAPSIAALFATLLVMVCNTPLANLQKSFHGKVMEAKDSRIKTTSETLKNMRVLKLHSWETTYLQNILKLRETERSWLRKYLYSCSGVAFLFWTSPTLVSVITFGVSILVQTPLTSSRVLSALATLRVLQEPISNLPEIISLLMQTKVSIDRIEDFMKEDITTPTPNRILSPSNVSILMEVGEYTWEPSNTTPKEPTVQITNSIQIMRGDKVAVCGTIGSGKSSLLCSILEEIPRISGVGTKVFGSKAYVPQTAWIQSGTVRDNVLFGKEMQKNLYEEVLRACALNKDIQKWLDGDLSVVGEKGLNLSGGQKQRIQLARAIYSEAEVYLLDDPFSAVDAHTGAHLFKECLMRLLSEKTVVYVTHQLEFLDASDLILVMKDGKIVQSGKYEELMAETNGELVKQMKAHNKSLRQVTPCEDEKLLTAGPRKKNQTGVEEEISEESNSNINLRENSNEETESGRVKWKVYSTFLTSAYGGVLVPVTLLCQILFQGLQIGSSYWIAWATEKRNISKEKLIWVFVLLSGLSSVFILGRALLLSTIALETASRLFLGMINSVFRAPTSFFDSTPSSRILNRSSTDQSTVDTDIPYRVAGLAFALIQLFSIIVLMSYVAWPVFFLFVAIFVISIWYQAYYITTARELSRMVGVRKSPILHHFSESIAGATTIRCFNREDRFFVEVKSLIDDYSRVVFHNSAMMEWLCARINFLFNLVFFLVLVILVTLPKEAINPCFAGLAATFGLNLNVLQAWVIWNFCNVENKMISVERILQFSNIPSEAPLKIDECTPEPDWPMNGYIELHNLHVRYRPSLPMVLKGVTCEFPSKKKIGVVGRTGSGKSTLIQALFRVVEPSEGRILIDGLDISKMGLHDLRSRLGIIPQDPTLFQGTMRTNLDPLDQHSDTELWEVLNKCHLREIVRQDQRHLDMPVSEDGENWSVGQRQLVCLARALLKKRRILVLDEATASVDTGTDNKIQSTIREETNGCTVITVAHRIPTVIDNDLVLVLDEGKILEYDSPTKLMQDNSSAFSSLAMEFLRRSHESTH